jgi:hypothetical protein
MDSVSKTKVCSRCKIEKSLTEYYPRRDRVNQVRPKCKACDSELAKQHYHNNADKMAEYREKTKDRKAEWSKQYAKTDKAKELRAKTREKNKAKRNAYNKAWREKNKERAAQHWRNRRARLLNAPSDNYTVDDVLRLYGNSCHICNDPIDLAAPRKPMFVNDTAFYFGLHLDHIIPLSKGGNDLLENVRPSHAICNLQKGHW